MVIKNDTTTFTDKEYPIKLRYNLGTEISYNFAPTWAIATDLAFQSKGFFGIKYSRFENGILTNVSKLNTEMFLLEGAISIEKTIKLTKPDNRITINVGSFYGYQIIDLGGIFKRQTYDDLGASVGIGFMRKQLFYKVVFEKGFVDVDRDPSRSFRTNVMLLKIGYVFYKL